MLISLTDDFIYIFIKHRDIFLVKKDYAVVLRTYFLLEELVCSIHTIYAHTFLHFSGAF